MEKENEEEVEIEGREERKGREAAGMNEMEAKVVVGRSMEMSAVEIEKC